MKINLPFFALFVSLILVTVQCGEAPKHPFEEGRQLEQQGNAEQAFLKYMVAPGSEHAAARIARAKPREILPLLEQRAAEFPAARVALVKTDVYLALGRKDEALAACRDAAAHIATKPGDGWKEGLFPADYYPGELSEDLKLRPGHDHVLMMPFSYGPGSHRDNMLIRRFITLDAAEDAGNEFARILELHRKRSQPHEMTTLVQGAAQNEFKPAQRRVVPSGFDGRGMQFAVDYAFHLKRRKMDDKAFAILQEVFVLLDLDKDPNLIQFADAPREVGVNRGWSTFMGENEFGMMSADFIRTAFGEYKNAGKVAQLKTALEEAARGNQRSKRVLASVLMHEGDTDGALKLELEYIAAGNFDALSTAYRRALVFEALQKNAEAAAEYEKAQSLSNQAANLNLPAQAAVQWPSAFTHLAAEDNSGEAALRGGIVGRLKRLYQALGKGDRVQEMKLAQHEASPQTLAQIYSAEAAFKDYVAAGQEARFFAWARAHATSPMPQAIVAWMTKDYDAVIRALVAAPKDTLNEYAWADWYRRFGEVAKDKVHALAAARIAAHPGDVRAKLDFLNLVEGRDTPETIAVIEAMLAPDAPHAFPKEIQNFHAKIRDYYTLAYRLMRHYEKTGQKEKIVALGLRAARVGNPFDNTIDVTQYGYRDGNALPEHGNACLALAIQYVEKADDINAYAGALAQSPWEGARNQIERRKAGGWKPKQLAAFGWANAPVGVSLLASNTSVLSLAQDERHVYAGHPWGVAVYDTKGEPVTRVALAEAANALVVASGILWVGTPKGLFLIDPKDWSVGHQWLNADVVKNQVEQRNYWHDNCVNALAIDGELLWIGLSRNVQALNTRTLELRPYSFDELKIKRGGEFWNFVVEKDYVWVDGDEGLRRFERKTGTWMGAALNGKAARLLGDIEGTLFGTVDLPEPLRARPCVIARETLELTPILIDDPTHQTRCINGPFHYFGKRSGKHVFGGDRGEYTFDAATKKMRPITDPYIQPGVSINDMPAGAGRGDLCLLADGTLAVNAPNLTYRNAKGATISRSWSSIVLPDGTRVVGAAPFENPRYRYNEGTSAAAEAREAYEHEGGLYFVDRAGKGRCVSDGERADCLRGDAVFSVVPWSRENQKWVCTNMGVAVIDGANAATGSFTRGDGLCANRVTSGAECGGKIYFATNWNDSGGGLAVFDPATSIFTGVFTQDGLSSNKIVSVVENEGKLRLGFNPEYQRRGNGNRLQFSPGVFNPTSGEFISGGKAIPPEYVKVKSMFETESSCLGGRVLQQFHKDGLAYVCTSRGLMIRPVKESPALAVTELKAKLATSVAQDQQASATRHRRQIRTPDDLATALKDANPFSRAFALAEVPYDWTKSPEGWFPLVAAQLHDANVYVRYAAMGQLIKADAAYDAEMIVLLKKSLNDAEEYFRVAAAIELARRGDVPDLKYLEELGREHRKSYDPPIDTRYFNVGISVRTSNHEMNEALAVKPTPAVFAFLLKYPPHDNYSVHSRFYPVLGKAIRSQPESVRTLLTAYDDQGSAYPPRRLFATQVLGCAGVEVLPVLHAALKSSDRVVLSNAARACGAIGDQSSIAPLIAALEFESALSRASVVQALGQLEARDALPRLKTMYAEAAARETLPQNTQTLFANAQAESLDRYRLLRDIETLKGGTDELKRAQTPMPIRPNENEELVHATMILKAIREIGGASSEFWRGVAGSSHYMARLEASAGLAEAEQGEKERNIAVLEGLFKEDLVDLKISAAVSLHILGYAGSEKALLGWLKQQPSQYSEREKTVEQLLRVKDGAKLAFAIVELETYINERHDTQGERHAKMLLEAFGEWKKKSTKKF